MNIKINTTDSHEKYKAECKINIKTKWIKRLENLKHNKDRQGG